MCRPSKDSHATAGGISSPVVSPSVGQCAILMQGLILLGIGKEHPRLAAARGPSYVTPSEQKGECFDRRRRTSLSPTLKPGVSLHEIGKAIATWFEAGSLERTGIIQAPVQLKHPASVEHLWQCAPDPNLEKRRRKNVVPRTSSPWLSKWRHYSCPEQFWTVRKILSHAIRHHGKTALIDPPDDQATGVQGKTVLFIDEISMRLGFTSLPIVVFMGDLYQFAPIKAQPLWQTPKNPRASLGQLVWQRFTDVRRRRGRPERPSDSQYEGLDSACVTRTPSHRPDALRPGSRISTSSRAHTDNEEAPWAAPR
ncbi:hypothetical protein V8E54_013316 [Elaphomyces granulatus]